MKSRVTIALDAMGGDRGPDVVIPAAQSVLARRNDVHLILVGDSHALEIGLGQVGLKQSDQLSIHHASEVVAMDESPSQAMRNKKDSSMRVSLNLLKQGDADACVSAGNTGALMAIARFVLKMLPGIDRPAICTALPAIGGHTWVLDLGANIDSSSEHLLQFAVMGSVLASAVDGIERPRVGLLNIGEEDIKGNDQIKQAARLLSDSPLNYSGFVEGNDIFRDSVDVVVCDGFLGNVSLKASEGLATMIGYYMKQEFSKNIWSKLVGLFAMPVLKAFRHRIDPRRYNGATLIGLQEVVIKSHGGADVFAFANAIEVAIVEARKGVPEMIRHQIDDMLNGRKSA